MGICRGYLGRQLVYMAYLERGVGRGGEWMIVLRGLGVVLIFYIGQC